MKKAKMSAIAIPKLIHSFNNFAFKTEISILDNNFICNYKIWSYKHCFILFCLMPTRYELNEIVKVQQCPNDKLAL